MIDLEQEFQLLMRTVTKQIEDKVQRGELTRPEANQLITMVNVRMASFPALKDNGVDLEDEDEGWSASTRACMGVPDRESDYPPFDDDDGWSGSTRCW